MSQWVGERVSYRASGEAARQHLMILWRRKSVEELVAIFADNVQAQRREIHSGSARQGNRHAKTYIRAVKELHQRAPEGLDCLAGLFEHPSRDVRSMAAAFLLRHATQEAIRVLEEVAEGPDLIALEAQYCLKGWRNGEWHLDEFP